LRTVDINAPLATPGDLPPLLNTAVPVVRPYAYNGDIYDYQSSGTFKQTQLLFNVNTQVGRWMTLFGRYSYNNAHSDTDGLGSIPSNTLNFAQDWGRSSMDIASNFFLGGPSRRNGACVFLPS
jgi:hypothetical protein